MDYLFANTLFNGDVSTWDTSNVESMAGMFASSNFNGNIKNWDVSNVIRFDFMFNHSPFNQDISRWDVSNATQLMFMFAESDFNQDMRKWNWQIQDNANVCAMFSHSKMDRKFIPKELKQKIIKQTLGGLK